jgi:glycine/D-amino acid oxidase-like deaminating enzyme
MTQIAIIGCGVVGATLAYELSQIPDLKVTVLDRQSPAQAATGAALGVLMGAISQKTRGRAWMMRQASLQRYETLIPELEAITGKAIPWNQQGILMLCFEADVRSRWQSLVDLRHTQGWELELWSVEQVRSRCPQIDPSRLTMAVYSPQDRQVDPTALTLALVAAAQKNGVVFHFDRKVTGFECSPKDPESTHTCHHVLTTAQPLAADWVIVAAGLGSTPLTQKAQRPVPIRPVLGQALQVHLDEPMGNAQFQPVITGEDIHIVPLAGGRYWVGATVEFPPTVEDDEIVASADRLEEVWQAAIALCPALQHATIDKTWSGLRPRPSDRSAPVIERLSGYSNVLIASGHYRNGVLLAPATALAVRETILGEIKEKEEGGRRRDEG